MHDSNHPDLLNGNPTKNIARLALPLVVAMFFQMGFNIVDMIFVGMISPEAIAAVSMVFPVIFFFISLAFGIGIGITSFVSRSVGAGDIEKAGRIALNGIFFGTVISILIGIVGFVLAENIFVAMGAGPEILEMVVSYSRIIFAGSVFLFVGIFCIHIIKGTGDTKTPMKFMITAALMNIVLDPLLIFGIGPFPCLGIEGAAIATIVSRSLVLVLALRHFASGNSLVKLNLKRFVLDYTIIKGILHVGIPASITNVSVSFGLMLFMKLVSSYGSGAVAAFGIGGRVESLAIMPAMAVSGAVLTIVGMNVGAGKFERARKTVYSGIMLVSGFMLLIGMMSFILSEWILSVFTDDPHVISLGIEYIKYRVDNNMPEAYIFVNKAGRHYSETGLIVIWRAVREKSGLDKSVRLYDAARHSFASQLINSGVSIYVFRTF